MTVLRVVDSADRPAVSRAHVCSFGISLLVHAALAFVLWCLVYANLRGEPIFLIGSACSTSQVELPLEIVQHQESGQPPAMPQEESPTPVPVDMWVAKRIEPNVLADRIRRSVEPASIDFFGTRAFGKKFVFVLDISYSMDARDGARFDRACQELLRSVSQLRSGQSYYVILFCWNTEKMFHDPSVEFINVATGHEEKLRRWIYDVSLGAGTDPRRALSLAHRLDPDAVFLLSDGHFNRPRTPLSETGWINEQGERLRNLGVQEGIELFFREVPIHTIALENPFTYVAMERIAQATGGSYRYVRTSSHAPIDTERFLTALRDIDQKHRNDARPDREYQSRLSYAREFTADGELVYAEYLVRPLRRANRSKIANPILLDQLLAILDSELGETRLEDYEPAPELSEYVSRTR